MADQPNNVFNSGEQSANPAATPAPADTTAPSTPDYSEYLQAIKNDAGEQKYSSVEIALKSLKEAQEYIPGLKTQLEQREDEIRKRDEQLTELRAKLDQAGNLEDIVERLRQNSPSNPQETPTVDNGLTEAAVLKLLEQKLTEAETTKAAQQNFNSVQDSLVQKFGEKANEVINTKAQELGTTAESLGELAKSNPKLVLALFNANQANPAPTSRVGGVRQPLDAGNELPDVKLPEKSLLLGATDNERADVMRQIRDRVYKRLGVES